jgi:DNA-binding IclR family transcriptional regulator
MQELASATGETVVLSVPDHLEAVAIEQVPGRRHPLRVEYDLGSRRPITKGASGRAMLAFLGDAVACSPPPAVTALRSRVTSYATGSMASRHPSAPQPMWPPVSA